MSSQKYQQLSEHFLAQARQELDAGDLPRASEKGWGATTQILKAIAEQRGVSHHQLAFQHQGRQNQTPTSLS